MATLEDIARALGVSKSTVSKALNDAPDVSVAMRTAALEKAELEITSVRAKEDWRCVTAKRRI